MRAIPSLKRRSRYMAAVAIWTARQQLRADGYTPEELERALGLSSRVLVTPLQLLGWRRIIRRAPSPPLFGLAGQDVEIPFPKRPILSTLWIPPGFQTPPPARRAPHMHRPLFKLSDD